MAASVIPFAAVLNVVHWGEFIPPLVAGVVYLTLYGRRLRTLARERRPVEKWRVASFITGVVLLVGVQIGPADDFADQVLIAHMVQHIIIGDFCSLLMVFGLTGPVLQPLLQIRFTRPVRKLAHPVVAVLLWAVDLYGWHVPFFYQLAIRHDLVHALEHACLLWFGTLLWLAVIGPLPKPAWFTGAWRVGYVIAIRLIGAVLGNVLIWTQTVLYPVYKSTDARQGLNPLGDQNIAGGIMMTEQIILTILLLGWLFYRFAIQDEERQALLDLAGQRGIDLSEERAQRAALAGTGATERLRERILSTPPSSRPEPAEDAVDGRGGPESV
jgi:cytochrome c oxidase assembly factor CtaG